jgi:hypothetical protein
MTDPAIMQLPVGTSADTGRGRRQVQAGETLMRPLVECGKAAEVPLWQLMTDADESVRRSTVILLNWRNKWKLDEGGRLVESRVLIDLNIPLLERALGSKDEQVRYWACAGLGDYADFSDECLERLKASLPKLRKLRNDGDPKVRDIAYIACTGIIRKLSERAKIAEDRKAASEELEKLLREKAW